MGISNGLKVHIALGTSFSDGEIGRHPGFKSSEKKCSWGVKSRFQYNKKRNSCLRGLRFFY